MAGATKRPKPSTAIRDARHPRRPEPGSDHRRGDDAGLPDLDLRAGGPGRAQGLRVLAHAEPDALRARGQPRGARGRAPAGWPSRRAAPRRPPCCHCSTRAITWSPATISTAAPSASSTRCFRRFGLELHLRRRRATPRAFAAAITPAHEAGAGSRRRPTRCSSSADIARRRRDLRSARRPASPSTTPS